jgi:hypothetical protein
MLKRFRAYRLAAYVKNENVSTIQNELMKSRAYDLATPLAAHY